MPMLVVQDFARFSSDALILKEVINNTGSVSALLISSLPVVVENEHGVAFATSQAINYCDYRICVIVPGFYLPFYNQVAELTLRHRIIILLNLTPLVPLSFEGEGKVEYINLARKPPRF